MNLPEGVQIKVRHDRRVSDRVEGLLPEMVPAYMARRWGARIEPLGGATVVTLRLLDGRAAQGVALCSDEDNYCKAYGRKIAMERALRNLFPRDVPDAPTLLVSDFDAVEGYVRGDEQQWPGDRGGR